MCGRKFVNHKYDLVCMNIVNCRPPTLYTMACHTHFDRVYQPRNALTNNKHFTLWI